jgi:amino acid permease
MLLTMSLQYVASTYQSVGLNMIPSIVFIMALMFRQEKLRFWNINGQAKIWGLLLSAAGALALVLWKGPVLLTSILVNIQATSDTVLGSVMIIVGLLATSFWNILVVRKRYLQLDLTTRKMVFSNHSKSSLGWSRLLRC